MKVRCIRREFGFGNSGNYYLEDAEGKKYFWNTVSDRAYEELIVGKEFNLIAYKKATEPTFIRPGYMEITKVRFKEV